MVVEHDLAGGLQRVEVGVVDLLEVPAVRADEVGVDRHDRDPGGRLDRVAGQGGRLPLRDRDAAADRRPRRARDVREQRLVALPEDVDDDHHEHEQRGTEPADREDAVAPFPLLLLRSQLLGLDARLVSALRLGRARVVRHGVPRSVMECSG
ncbi:hypothetical protein [Cellulomonas sp. P24]|uniref:hypothetical protein n=1 Tax=Cellulomonas sp. P24 TaxID=2885206 RepID=UPI00216AFDFA|nr:hypothetical protein [Cellulomonas sp. P24]MCR6493411.1 hypothetical protein [Cellulomonas sp. P24]